MARIFVLSTLMALLSSACAGERPAVLQISGGGDGIRVRYDLRARPFPEVPLPSDTATRLDEASPTGRFVNISMVGPTQLETEAREKSNRLSGFGVYMPISVPLDVPEGVDVPPLDLENVVTRQWKNKEIKDDVALLLNVDRTSEGFGEAVPLDFGQGNFPIVLERRDAYFDNDPRADGPNLYFESVDEDVNANGELDPGEDTNGDGHLGRANVFPGMAGEHEGDAAFVPGVDDLLPFLDLASNTLIFRPILPLRQRTRYAVVLTKNLNDHEGRPVRSPFDGIHPAAHKEALEPLAEVLEGHGFDLEDVSFAWAYSTQDITGDLEAIRAGLYGSGPLARLHDEFPTGAARLLPAKDGGEGAVYALETTDVGPLLKQVVALILPGGEDVVKAFQRDFDHVDYIVQGVVPGPSFLADKDGIATGAYPADDDESFEVDPITGEAHYGSTDISFWCAVPRAGMGAEPPFDVAIYAHSYTISRFELMGFLGRVVRYGMAACAIDAYGHGSLLGEDENPLKPVVPGDNVREALAAVFGAQTPLYQGPPYSSFVRSLEVGRARDLNNDGLVDTGGDFWTADLFHTRDIVRQTIVDMMQFIRLLRSFDGELVLPFDTGGDGRVDLAGDFNGDGTVDLGGPDAKVYLFGGSMGAILSGVMAGIEPVLEAAVPVAGGAGLIDIGIRSRQGGVPEAVFMPMLGPLVVGDPSPEDPREVVLRFQVNDVNRRADVVFHVTSEIEPGDRVEITNLANGERDQAIAAADRRFRLAVAADALTASEKRPVLGMEPDNGNLPVDVEVPELLGDPLEIRVYRGFHGPLKATIDTWNQEAVWQGARYVDGTRLTAISKGNGKKRQTPDFRRFEVLAALVLEAADPAAYARHVAEEPLSFPYDEDAEPGAHVLYIPTIGDLNVPINTGVAMARAAGLIELSEVDPRWGMSENDVLIANFVIEGTESTNRFLVDDGQGGKVSVLFDPDDLNFGSPDYGEPNLDPPLRLTKEVGGFHLALRMPYVEPEGSHGFLSPGGGGYDMFTFAANQIALLFASDGETIADRPCLETSSCEDLPERVRMGLPAR